IAHLLRAVGEEAVEAGNIGTPLSEVALAERKPAWVAMELSSFQLHDTPSVRPDVAVLTNLAPDHLDRYASVEEYYDDKLRILANATGESMRVVNADDAELMRRTAPFRGVVRTFSLRDAHADAWY